MKAPNQNSTTGNDLPLPEQDKATIQAIHDLILNDLKTPHTRQGLAATFEVTEYFIQKNFKKTYNTTIAELLKKNRMEKAVALLLSENDYPLKYIATQIGYREDTFIRAFHKYYKCYPHEYKQKQKDKQ